MNARRKHRLRSEQRWERIAAIKKANRGTPPPSICHRCNKPYTPEWVDSLAIWSRACEDCLMRNFFDALDLPTPPEFLDRYTINPTLTEADFRRQLHHGK